MDESTPVATFLEVQFLARLGRMQASETSAYKPGLRERKKQRTRETIARVALQLFAERGYDKTTLDDIAEAADVSKRTIFAYYQSKEDILFCDDSAVYEKIEQTLKQRPPGATTVDAIREFLSASGPPDDQAMLRKRIICTDEDLRLGERARFARVEELLAESIARDLGAGPDDIRPLLIAASVTAAFNAARDRLHARSSSEAITHEDALAILDQVVEFLRGGLEALQQL
jgi:AcrR family transcriptional regulator